MDGYINLQDDDEFFTFLSQTPDIPQADGDKVGIATVGPCVKCEFHNVVEEVYGSPEELGLFFSKSVAEGLTRGQTPRTIPERLLNFYAWKNEFSEAHVAHVDHVETPGIAVMGAIEHEGQPRCFTFLIDGTHRAVAAIRAGREFKAYVLGAYDTMVCAESTGKRLQQSNFQLFDPCPNAATAA
jgi:hypothetical protein